MRDADGDDGDDDSALLMAVLMLMMLMLMLMVMAMSALSPPRYVSKQQGSYGRRTSTAAAAGWRMMILADV
jgi:hypothetical protein